MSQPRPTVATPVLYRITAIAGVGAALVLLVNAAKRAEFIPNVALTQLIAPLGQVLSLALVTGLYFAVARRTGVFGLVAFLVNAAAIAALVGVEFVINLVFTALPGDTIAELLAGTLGTALRIVSVAFLAGTLLFALALALTRIVPIVPLLLYVVGAVPVALRNLFPEVVLQLGIVVLAAGIGWLAIWLWLHAVRTPGELEAA